MNISSLREIGRELLKIAPRYRFAPDCRHVLKTGASGDPTFPFDKACEDVILSNLIQIKKYD